MRDGRYCLPVKTENKGQIQGIVHDQSGSGKAVFIEPLSVVRLNKHVFKFGWENIPSDFLDTLETYAKAATVTVGWRSQSYTCRIRDFQPKMVSRSEVYTASDGLWNVTLTATEV